jgi:hypothetical protein
MNNISSLKQIDISLIDELYKYLKVELENKLLKFSVFGSNF